MSNETFFSDTLSDWGRHKLKILTRYLRIWTSKLGSRSDTLVFVDTCAGRGAYGDGEHGSPVLAAEMNEYLRPRGKRLLIIACETDPESAQELIGHLRRYIDQTPPLAEVHLEAFEEILPDIMEATSRMPTFVFVDSWGVKELAVDKLRPLLDVDNREPTELLIRVEHVALARLAGVLSKQANNDADRRNAEQARQLLQKLHVRPELLDEIESEDSDKANGVALLNELVDMFKEEFRFVQLIPVRASYHGSPRYFLLHCTKSEHGIALMNDVVSTAEDAQFVEYFEAKNRGQGDLFGPHFPPPRFNIDQLKDEVTQGLRRRQADMSYWQIRAHLALEFGTDFRQKHHDRALKDLVAEGRIAPLDETKKPNHRRYRLATEQTYLPDVMEAKRPA